MVSILDEIVQNKSREVRHHRKEVPVSELKELAENTNSRSFTKPILDDGIQLISEIKPESPSSGVLTDLSPKQISWVYEEEYPAAVSVLTDQNYFGMTLDNFREVRGVLSKPVLRKEFIIDPYQIYQSAALGADCILLISAVLDREQLEEFYEIARELNLDVLVEIHSRQEWEDLPINPDLLGINNRELSGDFQTDLSVTEEICGVIPDTVNVISESGISDKDDVDRLSDVENVEGILVGTSLLKGVEEPESIRNRIQRLMSSVK